MGLLDELFSPWRLGAPGNGLFGGVAPETTQDDVAALIAASPRSRHAPGFLKGLSYREPNGDPNAGQSYTNGPLPEGLPPMPLSPATVSLEPFPKGLQRAPGIPTAPLVEPNRSDAEPRAASSGAASSPIMPLSPGIRPDQFADSLFGNRQQAPIDEASVPLPRPRPQMAASDDTLPPNATPTVGAAAAMPLAPPPASAQPPGAPAAAGPGQAMPPPSPSLGQSVNTKLMDIAGILSPQMRERQIQNQTVQAMIRRGVPQDVAVAAASNPEIMKQVLPGAFGPRQYQFQTTPDGAIVRIDPTGQTPPQAVYQSTKPAFSVIGKDRDGNDVHGFVDPTSKKVFDLQGNPISANSGLAGMAGNAESGLSGEEFLKSLNDRGRADLIKSMVEGRIAPAQMGRFGTAAVQSLLKDAARYEPGFDLTAWTGRSNGMKDFYGGGKSSEMVRAANQTIHHVGELVGSMDKLKNRQSPQWNAVANTFGQKVMGEGAVTEFLPNAHAVAEEMSKVFKGANLSDAEIRQWEASLNENMSPEQQRASVGKLLSLLNGSLQALETKRRASLGDTLSDKKGPLLDKHSQDALERVGRWIKGEKIEITSPVASSHGSATPAPAAKIVPPGNYNWTPDGLVAR